MSSIEKLIDIFRKFPTVGPRTARRFVYHLIKLPKEQIDELSSALQELKNKIKLCQFCFNPFESFDTAQDLRPFDTAQDRSNEGPSSGSSSSGGLCAICSDPRRKKNILCIVEKEADLLSIENTKKYSGLYFILGGTLAMMRKEDIDNLRIEQLKQRVKTGNFSEIIIALNPTPEGRATSILVERIIKQLQETFSAEGGPQPKADEPRVQASGWKITHLAQGLPVGGELEYADEETLESAFEGRK